jgi:uncharacterized protein (DUF952 family)
MPHKNRFAPACYWRKARTGAGVGGAMVDIAAGDSHFSTVEQAEATAAKYFSGKDDLLLNAVGTKRLRDGLRFESSGGGTLFHIFMRICRSMPWSGQNACLSGRTAAMISLAF